MERAFALLRKLKEHSHETGNRHMDEKISSVTAVLSSNLFKRCHEFLRILNSNTTTEGLDHIMQQLPIYPQIHALSPLTPFECKHRVEQIASKNYEDFYLVEFPSPAGLPQETVKRSGIILRQAGMDLTLPNLFIAAIEDNSPASRARNIKCGDQVLVVNGYPLDWRTIEQLRYGLLDRPELEGLSRNGNVFELAEHLLNEPYRHGIRQGMEILTIIVARKQNFSTRDAEELEADLGNKLRVSKVNPNDIFIETVLIRPPESEDLGIRLGCDKDGTGIYVVYIIPNSVAAADGILRKGDRVIQVNYQDVDHLPVRQGIEFIKTTSGRGSFIHLKCIRPVHLPVFPKAQESLEMDQTADSSQQDNHDMDTVEEPTRIVEAIPFLQRCQPLGDDLSDEYDLSEITPDRMDYARYWDGLCVPDTRIIVCDYALTNSCNGLGLSIEGTLEKFDADDIPQPHHYIIDVLPDAPSEIRQMLQPGDELLQVNRHKLFALPHLEVAKLLHEIPSEGYVICARQGAYMSVETTWRPSVCELESVYEDVEKEEEEADEEEDEPMEPDEVFIAEPINHQPTGPCPLTTVIVENRMRKRVESCSSDIEKANGFPKILYSRAYKSIKTDESLEIEVKSDAEESNHSPTANDIHDRYSVKSLPTSSGSVIFVRSECKNGMDADSEEDLEKKCTFPRLPMPARLTALSAECVSLPSPLRIHTPDIDAFGKARETCPCIPEYDYQNQCWVLRIVKRAGEFLGLEVEADDAGPNGVKLINITPGSPIDRLKEMQGQKYRSSRSWSPTPILYQQPPFPEPGDWIVGVGLNNFACQSGFTARHILRKLVRDAGLFEIRYIQQAEE